MSSSLISRSPHLLRLRDEGFTLEVAHGYLLVRDVPYVNANREVRTGTLVFRLDLTANVAIAPSDHTAYFIGEVPCDAHGTPLTRILNHSNPEQLAPDIQTNHYFSAKPRSGNYKDYYEKVIAYVNMLSGHARAIDDSLRAQVFKPLLAEEDEGPFVYIDTASTRAGIAQAASRLAGQRIAIVGLGGTGAYVLDLVSKTPVTEIHLYDGDILQQHNAFRYPGAVAFDALKEGRFKVDYLAAEYGRIHRGIHVHTVMINENNVSELAIYDAVFVCVDSGHARRLIADSLAASDTVMFDTGMGVQMNTNSELFAIVRLSTLDRASAVEASRNMPMFANEDDNLYGTNIQVGDLNCLNAYLAVEAWKKRCGFYFGKGRPHLTTYTTASGSLAANEADE